jgi:hypothetical protein
LGQFCRINFPYPAAQYTPQRIRLGKPAPLNHGA